MKEFNKHFTPYEIKQEICDLGDDIYVILPNDMKSQVIVAPREKDTFIEIFESVKNLYTVFSNKLNKSITYIVESSVRGNDSLWLAVENKGLAFDIDLIRIIFPDVKGCDMEVDEEEDLCITNYFIRDYTLSGEVELDTMQETPEKGNIEFTPEEVKLIQNDKCITVLLPLKNEDVELIMFGDDVDNIINKKESLLVYANENDTKKLAYIFTFKENLTEDALSRYQNIDLSKMDSISFEELQNKLKGYSFKRSIEYTINENGFVKCIFYDINEESIAIDIVQTPLSELQYEFNDLQFSGDNSLGKTNILHIRGQKVYYIDFEGIRYEYKVDIDETKFGDDGMDAIAKEFFFR